MGNYFKSGFDAVYYARVHCPVCKERIYANAQVCPKCKTDLMVPNLQVGKKWQKEGLRIVLVFSIIIGLLICFTDAPLMLGIISGLLVYALGYAIVQKIQSVKNYFHK